MTMGNDVTVRVHVIKPRTWQRIRPALWARFDGDEMASLSVMPDGTFRVNNTGLWSFSTSRPEAERAWPEGTSAPTVYAEAELYPSSSGFAVAPTDAHLIRAIRRAYREARVEPSVGDVVCITLTGPTSPEGG